MKIYQPQVKDRRACMLVMAKILRLQARKGKGRPGGDQTATRSVSGSFPQTLNFCNGLSFLFFQTDMKKKENVHRLK